MLDIHCPITIGGCVYFAQPDALRGSLALTLRDVKPTYFMGVPRVWEKIYEKMVSEDGANMSCADVDDIDCYALLLCSNLWPGRPKV